MAASSNGSASRCALCGREGVETTVHHLTPREAGGALLPTAPLCRPCHKQVHALYTNRDLVALGLTTVEALQRDPAIARFLKWIRKQPPETVPRVRKSARVRGKG